MTAESAPVVVLTPTFALTAPEALTLIEEAGGRVMRRSVSDDGWREAASSARALVVGTQVVDAGLISAAPDLRLIAKHGAGTDNIDVTAATAAGIAVSAAPGLNASAVAELTMALILAAARGIVHADALVRGGAWPVHVGTGLSGSTLGIVGLGAIGRLVAERAEPFGARILGYDLRDDAAPGPWTRVRLDELLRSSDVVSLHVPLTDETRHLVDARALALMKPTAILVNTSRGGVIDDNALAIALEHEKLGAAALDVLADEPPPADHPLLRLPGKTIITPHMAGYTTAALAATSLAVARDVRDSLVGRWPSGAINDVAAWRAGGGRP